MPLDAAELAADADVDERPVGENMQQVTRRAQAQDAADRYVSMCPSRRNDNVNNTERL